MELLGDVLARLGARNPEIFKNLLVFEVSGSSQERLGASWERLLGVSEAPWGVVEEILRLLGDVLAPFGARKPEIIENPSVFQGF